MQPSLQGCNAVDTHAPQLDAPACAMPSYGSFQPPLRVDCNILDGGGLGSSADWFVPRVSEDLFLQLRHKFQSWALEWRVVDRLRKHVAAKCSDCLFTKAEIHLLQAGLVEFLNSRGHTCNSCVEPHQPFLLSAWRALTEFVQDIDGSLPNVLSEGVPTGIVGPIPASGVWEPLEEPINVADEPDLVVHDQPWKSAQSDPVLVQTLLRKDIDVGHLVHLPGGESAARERWGDRLAAGKFGLVTTPGKKPRLVGDGTISGANGRRILQKFACQASIVCNASLVQPLQSKFGLHCHLTCGERTNWCACGKMNKAILVLFLKGSGIFTALAILDANGQHIGLPG